jgi:hypothetical protein
MCGHALPVPACPSVRAGTVATGISFNSDGKTGFLPADDNGSGDTVLITSDGGNTWNRHAQIQFDLVSGARAGIWQNGA